MTEFEALTIDRIDDISLRFPQLERMQVANLLDWHIPTRGNGQDMSLGTISEVWLSYMLSEGNYWLNHVVQAKLQPMTIKSMSPCKKEP